MKSYIIHTNKHVTDMTEVFSQYGKAEMISRIFDTYLLETDISIDEIKKIKGVTSVHEERIASLN